MKTIDHGEACEKCGSTDNWICLCGHVVSYEIHRILGRKRHVLLSSENKQYVIDEYDSLLNLPYRSSESFELIEVVKKRISTSQKERI